MFILYTTLYNVILVPIMKIVFYFGSFFNKKIKEGYEGRKNYFINAQQQAKTIPSNAKIFLIHSSSVGEWEQAVPIIEKLKEKDPTVFVIVTFFSSSGYTIVKNAL